MSRAERRHHNQRLKKARHLYWGGRDIPLTPRQLGLVLSAPQPMKCQCCSNQRQYVGRSIKERSGMQTKLHELP